MLRTIASGLLVGFVVAACGGDEANTLDRSRLGEPCDLTMPCPAGYSCTSITVNVGERIDPTCVKDGPCPLTCASGSSCIENDSAPGEIACARD